MDNICIISSAHLLQGVLALVARSLSYTRSSNNSGTFFPRVNKYLLCCRSCNMASFILQSWFGYSLVLELSEGRFLDVPDFTGLAFFVHDRRAYGTLSLGATVVVSECPINLPSFTLFCVCSGGFPCR